MSVKKLITACLLAVFIIPRTYADDVSIEVDTQHLTLAVKYKQQTLMTLENIAIGRNGAGFKQKVGDDVTPLGQYKIGWVNNKSIYYRFYGFNYPSLENAARAYQEDIISKDTYNTIRLAHHNDKTPLQNSILGGQIGIHGLGKADEKVHQMMNWTHGCIALTNAQIDLLHPWLIKGTSVTVK